MTDILSEGRARPTGERGARGPLPALVAGLVLGLLLAGVVALVNGGDRRTVLERHAQPASVQYPDKSLHHLGLIETRSLVFGRHRTYQLVTGSDPALGYGHLVELEFTGSRPRFQNVRWEPVGVRIVFRSGHETFIPARSFMYGR